MDSASERMLTVVSPLGEALLAAADTRLPLAQEEPEGEEKLSRAALNSTCSSEALEGEASPVRRELPNTMKLHSFILKNILHFNKKRLSVRK